MTAKAQHVELFNKDLNINMEFEINHAERILRMPNNGGWQLPEETEFKFDFNDGIGYRENKKGVAGVEKKADNK